MTATPPAAPRRRPPSSPRSGGCSAATGPTSTAPRQLRQTDVLVVAPYNAQVLLLRQHLDAAGLSDVPVGTVDKFQGRQAPVVFVSMTASSIDDVPRGISFLLNRNRLNVAVSRAKYRTASSSARDAATDYLPSTPAAWSSWARSCRSRRVIHRRDEPDRHAGRDRGRRARHHRSRRAGRPQRRPHRALPRACQRAGAAGIGRRGGRGTAGLPRRRRVRHRAGRADIAGGRDRARARRCAAVDRTADRYRRGRRRRAADPGRCGATLADGAACGGAAGLVFGVDLAARDSATVGGMASTNAGGLRTVRYGNMGEQVIGLDVALPDGSVVHRHSQVAPDNTGYDLASLFIGAEGTLGVITGLDLRLHPTPTHRVTAICGFDDLDALVESGRAFRDMDGIAALELIDAARQRADRRAPRRRRAGRRRLAAAHRIGRRHRPDRAAGRRARGRAAVRASRRSASTSTRSSGSGRSANRSPRCSASTGRR